MEKRQKLTDKQVATIREAGRRVAINEALYREAVTHAREVSALVLDFYGFPANARSEIDEKTNELVVLLPDPPAAESAPDTTQSRA